MPAIGVSKVSLGGEGFQIGVARTMNASTGMIWKAIGNCIDREEGVCEYFVLQASSA